MEAVHFDKIAADLRGSTVTSAARATTRALLPDGSRRRRSPYAARRIKYGSDDRASQRGEAQRNATQQKCGTEATHHMRAEHDQKRETVSVRITVENRDVMGARCQQRTTQDRHRLTE